LAKLVPLSSAALLLIYANFKLIVRGCVIVADYTVAFMPILYIA
jgi:hypothetical protein